MEEDFKILENFINHIRVEEKLQYGMGMYIQAIENLLKRYKELEEREIWSTATIEGLKNNFIPKLIIHSKKRELIEEDNYGGRFYSTTDVIALLDKLLAN